MASLLEQCRQKQEDIERLETRIVQELEEREKSYLGCLYQSHRVHHYLEEIKESSERVLAAYADEDRSRAEELESMVVDTSLSFFYDKINEIAAHYGRNPEANIIIRPPPPRLSKAERQKKKTEAAKAAKAAASAAESASSATVDGLGFPFPFPFPGMEATPEEVVEEETFEPHIHFTGEECYGRYFDLHELHSEYNNIPSIHQIDYLAFAEQLPSLGQSSSVETTTPAEARRTAAYKLFLDHLYDYLKNFLQRTQPLFDLMSALREADEHSAVHSPSSTAFSSSASASASSSNPLYCEACQKLFTKDTVFAAHLSGKKHIQAASKPKSQIASSSSPQINAITLEGRVRKLVSVLDDVLQRTVRRIERKQTMTAEELRAEADAELQELEARDDQEQEEEEEEESSDNAPKNLVLGPDGKPLPYWLYKLHGLNLEYKCEICGNASYMGPRAFEKHFSEARHAHGLRCLKIPNTRHFNFITSIAEAVDLWNRLKMQKATAAFQAELEEEYEDDEGNVLNKKTFLDLKRQGII